MATSLARSPRSPVSSRGDAHRPVDAARYRQQSLDELGTPLSQVTFCVIDLETTGASPATCAITEVGAAKFRGGECVGTLQTLVNPGVPIPPTITLLTGITESMVGPAPPIGPVLTSLVEFARETVVVGHNVRFDLSFLNHALRARGAPALSLRSVDTCRLARRLLADEVPDCRLATLARQLRLPHQPCHRAFADVLATADLLHLLFERAAALGVLGLDDLLELPTLGRHPQAAKLRLTDALPRSPGVYLFRERGGAVLYIGKAANLRARVRSYFGADRRRKVGPLLEATAAIDHVPCDSDLEAAVLEIRLIQRHLPRFNRVATQWPRYAYLRVSGTYGRPSLAVTRNPAATGRCIGPLASSALARQALEALREALSARVEHDSESRERPTDLVVDDPELLTPLAARMRALAAEQRFEEAAAVRDRAGVLDRALDRQRRLDALRDAGLVTIGLAPRRSRTGSDPASAIGSGYRGPGSGATAASPRHRDQPTTPPLTGVERVLTIEAGRLVLGRDEANADACSRPVATDPVERSGGTDRHPPRDRSSISASEIDERALVAAWLDAHSHRVRLLAVENALWWPLVRRPRFEPALRRLQTAESPVPNRPDLPARPPARIRPTHSPRRPKASPVRLLVPQVPLWPSRLGAAFDP